MYMNTAKRSIVKNKVDYVFIFNTILKQKG